jgi:charged multivesicular body protein 4
LEDELENMEQEVLDKKMLDTGTVPVGDQVHKMPAVANGGRESTIPDFRHFTNIDAVKVKKTADEIDEEEELRKLQAEMAM